MDRALVLFAIGLVFGGGIGFVAAAGNGVTFDGHDHGDQTAMGHGDTSHAMMHDTSLDVPATGGPKVSVMIMPDPMTGYNLRVMVNNFTFSPERASLAAVPGEGHAHVYVNGEKLSRIYSEWMHIAALPKGDVEVDVTLIGNDHRPLALNGTPISASTTLTVD